MCYPLNWYGSMMMSFQIGTHSELIKKKGLYAELVRRQTMD